STGSPDTAYVQWIYVGAGVVSRTWTVKMPMPGTFEFRLFLNNGYTRAAASPTVAVKPPVLTVDAANVLGGTDVTVTPTNGLGGPQDWLACAYAGSRDTSCIEWVSVGSGVASRRWMVTTPTAGGTFEFRLFLNNGYTRVATSPPVTVAPGP